ncbi:hypothetical protein QSV08_04800 [Maribacter sp. BPC-D8]|uniref:hypothetical protein n=1 Tax=Maribacter sp. BPC-D8 TaxID=3053613 RepID=UPI002B4A2B2D|nr:hypothetical protein [Maribacter sp. BPC-D8]WRI30560.1 hypothetical protein QSV08_04800 [Maribacter sp. BPC-D8]
MISRSTFQFNSIKLSYFFLLSFFVFIVSCSKDSDGNSDKEVVACFNIVKDTLYFNETLQIENCSQNAVSYTYRVAGFDVTLEELATMQFSPGNKMITMGAYGENGETDLLQADFQQKEFYVKEEADSYFFPDEFLGSRRLLKFDRHPFTNEMYAIYVDFNDLKYYYAAISEDLEFTLIEINTGYSDYGYRALCDFQDDGTIYIDMPFRYTNAIIRQRHIVNIETGLSPLTNLDLLSYDFDVGYTTLNNKAYAFGANFTSEPRKYVPAINTLVSGETETIKEFDFGDKSGVIGNLTPFRDGFLAFAGAFDFASDGLVSNATTRLLELDAEFNLVNSQELDALGEATIGSLGTMSAPYHMVKLPNDNILLYGLNTLRILDSNLAIIHAEALPGFTDQSHLILDDHIYLSATNYLYKYSFDGTRLAELKVRQNGMRGIVPYKNGLIFMAELNDLFAGGNKEVLTGIVDKDLKLLPLK